MYNSTSRNVSYIVVQVNKENIKSIFTEVVLLIAKMWEVSIKSIKKSPVK